MQEFKTRLIISPAIITFIFSTIVTAQDRKMVNSQGTFSETVESILQLERERMEAIKNKALGVHL